MGIRGLITCQREVDAADKEDQAGRAAFRLVGVKVEWVDRA